MADKKNTLLTDESAKTESPIQSPTPNNSEGKGTNDGAQESKATIETAETNNGRAAEIVPANLPDGAILRTGSNPVVNPANLAGSNDGPNPAIPSVGNGSGADGREANGQDTSEWELDPRRATYLRKKQKEGTALRDDEIKWLDWYEENKRPRGAQAPKDSPPGDVPIKEAQPAKVSSPPPRVYESVPVTINKEWKKKYSGGIENGRELLCSQLGTQMHKWMMAMEQLLKDASIEPIVMVSDDATRNLFICAFDDILPEYLKATPAILMTMKVASLTTQRVWKRKQILEVMNRKKTPLGLIDNSKKRTEETKPKVPIPTTPIKEDEPYHEVQINSEGDFIIPKGTVVVR